MHAIESFLQELASVLQIVKIYTANHPKSEDAVDRTFARLDTILGQYNEITIGIVGGEFVFGSEIFFDLSNRLRELIVDLTSRGIEKMIFVNPIAKEELKTFIGALNAKKDDFGEDFQRYFERLQIRNIYVGKITISAKRTEQASPEEKTEPAMGYEDTLGIVSGSFTDILENRYVDAGSTTLAMKNALMMALEGRWEFLAISSVKRYDLNTFVHSLNVAVLAMFFSTRLGFKKDDVLKLGNAALFHDMGKIAISRKVVQKPGSLTDDEFVKMKSHAVMGAEILIRYIDTLSPLPAIVAYEHHLRFDLKGYPKLAYPAKPNTASLIVAICDCYDALRQKRSYKRDYPPEMIYEIMYKERGKMFEPHLLERFFGAMGVYPVGTVVELTNGWVAVVKVENEAHIVSPQVEIIEPEEKSGSQIDLAREEDIAIKCTLDKPTKGEDYIPHV